jgi:hypothetical protein
VSETVTCWRISDAEVELGTLKTAWLGVVDRPEAIVDQPVAVLALLAASQVRCSSWPLVVS